ncbi:MAG: glycosyltransferase, partial [Planctomycetota bacterium JB042]
RADVAELFSLVNDRYALMCVQHDHRPEENVKMDGQVQTRYRRKNWSSLMLWNCDHPGNERLTPELVNGLPGRDLHRFCWLEDREIGALPGAWNWLEGISDPAVDPKAVHFTRGGPWHEGFEDVRYADEWRSELRSVVDAERSLCQTT